MRAEPDGYTLLMGTIGTHAINPYVYPKIGYDPVKDFSPIIQFGTAPNVLVVNPSVPVKTVKELIDYIRARPGQLNYASSGNGTSNHLSGAMFAAREGLVASHVPYRGGAQAITDLLRGEVQFMFYHYLPLLPHIAEGKLRAIAITSAARISALPDVPTMAEAGISDFEVSAWFGVYGPAKMQPEMVAMLNKTIFAIMESEATKESDRAGHRSGQRLSRRSVGAHQIGNGALAEGCRTRRRETGALKTRETWCAAAMARVNKRRQLPKKEYQATVLVSPVWLSLSVQLSFRFYASFPIRWRRFRCCPSAFLQGKMSPLEA